MGTAAALIYMKRQRPPRRFCGHRSALLLWGMIGRVDVFLTAVVMESPAVGIYFPVHQAHLHPTQLYDGWIVIDIFCAEEISTVE